MNNDDHFSPLWNNIRAAFSVYADDNRHSYLLVYWAAHSDTLSYEPVKKGQYPWGIHDAHMAFNHIKEDPRTLVMAFDLSEDFAEQVPEYMRDYTTLQSFLFTPMINIPDRTGKIMSQKKWERDIEDALRENPVLRLVHG